MRDREEIEREIQDRSGDLTRSIQELKEVVRDKVEDIKHAINVPERAREAAAAAAERIQDVAADVRETVRRRPQLAIAVSAGAVLAVLAFFRVRRIRRRLAEQNG